MQQLFGWEEHQASEGMEVVADSVAVSCDLFLARQLNMGLLKSVPTQKWGDPSGTMAVLPGERQQMFHYDKETPCARQMFTQCSCGRLSTVVHLGEDRSGL